MSLTLFGSGHSRSFRCLWALCETELDFEYVAMNFTPDSENSVASQDYLQKNAQGKVPTLEQNGFVLTESLAIINHIAALSEHTWIPTTPQSRARYDELTSFIVTELEQPLWTTGKHRFALPKEQRVPEVMATAQFEFAKAVRTLNHMLELTGPIIDDQFTFADIMLAQTINWAHRFEFDLPETYLKYRDLMYHRAAAQRAIAMIS